MQLLKKNGKGTFRLPDRLAQKLIDKGKFQPADGQEEVKEPEVKKPEVKKESGKGKGPSRGKGKK